METQKSVIERWKEGMKKITPLQQYQATQKGNWVMVIGYISGLITMGFKIQNFWWIEIILGAGLFNHTIMMIGVNQKIKQLLFIEQQMKGGQECLKI